VTTTTTAERRMPFSHRWAKALATDGRLAQVDIAVGMTLSYWMDKDGGSCFPTHERVAFHARLAVGTVRRSIQRLREYGWLEKVSRSAPGRATVYRAVIPVVPPDHLRQYEHRAPGRGEQRAGERGDSTEQRAEETEQRAGERVTPRPGARPSSHEVSIINFRHEFPDCMLDLPESAVAEEAARKYPDEPSLQSILLQDWRIRRDAYLSTVAS